MTTPAPRHTLTAMTYNIRNAHPDPGHDWDDRAPLVAAIVRRAAPDVWGAQEVLRRQRDDLARLLPEYELFGQGRGGGDVDEFVPVLWLRSRFDRVDAGQFWLSDTPDVVASNTWQSLCPRCVTWVRLQPRTGGPEFVFATTHLDHEENAHGDEVRCRSAELIARRFADADAPVVLTGDLNTTPDTAPYRTLCDAGLAEVARGDVAARPTFHDYGREQPGRRIDAVFATAPAVVVAERVDESPDALVASDHFPIIAEVAIPQQ